MGLRPTGLRRSRGLPFPHPEGKGLSVPLISHLCLGFRRQSLIIWGPSRTGKTVWARSLGRQIYMNGHLNIDKYDDEADYAIFDDISGGFQFFPSYKGWLGCQEEFECTDKYRAKTTIYWGRPTIMCMNSDPLADPHVDVAWLLLNCEIVHIEDPLVEII